MSNIRNLALYGYQYKIQLTEEHMLELINPMEQLL